MKIFIFDQSFLNTCSYFLSRFHASDKMETRFLIRPFEVSEEDFVACNTSNGSQLTSNYTADVINVPKLGAGIHYFISK